MKRWLNGLTSAHSRSIQTRIWFPSTHVKAYHGCTCTPALGVIALQPQLDPESLLANSLAEMVSFEASWEGDPVSILKVIEKAI